MSRRPFLYLSESACLLKLQTLSVSRLCLEYFDPLERETRQTFPVNYISQARSVLALHLLQI
ncbi:hypothetical protein BKA82DRAFT_1002694 [Pisolithus tinctorius]|uniref:Uncharacterized protein n=1 Tax=Pisolithus tinctorius Marx 270 TaxID=870435 RepID=A0A0C3NM03_PISTI|nr:hypothetical protein BKA82DRAFT_1002694 [Pisolithus tinctorius]KIO01945.1 hypothetical protein M404DRAFT_1002694 [Pisolithus tinctorius Marx 270]